VTTITRVVASDIRLPTSLDLSGSDANDIGKHAAPDGWKPVSLELEDLENILEMHECTHVAMPEPWTGKDSVDFFAASDFIGMLRESAPA
jgi:hypothetical protein